MIVVELLKDNNELSLQNEQIRIQNIGMQLENIQTNETNKEMLMQMITMQPGGTNPMMAL